MNFAGRSARGGRAFHLSYYRAAAACLGGGGGGDDTDDCRYGGLTVSLN